MRSLFIKIFIWFWLAMALVNVAFFVTTELTRSQPSNSPFRDIVSNLYGMYAQSAVEVLETQGPVALAASMDQMEQKTHMRAELFDHRGIEIFGNDNIPEARESVARALKNPGKNLVADRRMGRAGLGPPHLLMNLVTGRTGLPYVLVVEAPPPPYTAGLKTLAFRLLALMMTGGILCYLLARYLTSPVAKLRATTQLLAAGDLTVRVGPLLGRRRDELADLGRDFDVMVQRLEGLVCAQQRLLGDISHELRSPLARLSVALGLARRRVGDKAEAELDRIEHEASTLNELIGQMLTLTRLECRVEDLNKSNIDLAAVVQQIADDADFEAGVKQSNVFITQLDECSINGSLELVHSAIENVVRNGVHYTEPQTEVAISLARIVEGGSEYAVVTVRDHGPGVPSAAIEHIFKPFYRVQDARDRQSGGTGLGLAITERAIRLHGGTVSAGNAPDGGLVVELWLPSRNPRFDRITAVGKALSYPAGTFKSGCGP
jgi:signal transduction histidine kinase